MQIDDLRRLVVDTVHASNGRRRRCPVVKGGIVLRPIWTTLSVAGEYDVRFSSAPNTGYVLFLIGVGRLRYD